MTATVKLQAPDNTPTADALYSEAQKYLAGGLCASHRLHPSLGRPFMASRGEGGRVTDVDGTEFIDLNMSYGAALLGHGHPAIKKAVESALDLGILCGCEARAPMDVARQLTEIIPCAERVRFTCSGTETTWHAIRTARAFTGRSLVVKFEGHFHGYNDVVGFSMWPPLDKAGPPDAPIPYPESAGMPPGAVNDVIVLPWNDLDAVRRTLDARGDDVAAVIMEPINYDSGGSLPLPGYLEGVREVTAKHGVVLIFDEVLSGFRTGPSCAQGYFGVTPDLCCLGKPLGGGLPISAFLGRREVMSAVTPVGRAVHTGTYNGNLVPILAADAFLGIVRDPRFWSDLSAKEEMFYGGLRSIFSRTPYPVWVQATGARFFLLFGLDHEPRNYRDAVVADHALERDFYRAAFRRGVYFQSGWHHGFSAAHTTGELQQALSAIESAAMSIRPASASVGR